MSEARQLREEGCLHTGGSTNNLGTYRMGWRPIGDLECPASLKTCRRDASCMIGACPASLPACPSLSRKKQLGGKDLTQSFKRIRGHGAKPLRQKNGCPACVPAREIMIFVVYRIISEFFICKLPILHPDQETRWLGR